MVFDAAPFSRWRVDYRGFREPFEFAAPQGNSYRDKERDVGGGNDLRGALRSRYFGGETRGLFFEAGCELDQNGIVGSAEFSSGVRTWIVDWIGAIRGAVCFWRARL